MKTTEFTGVRVEVETTLSFDEVNDRLRRSTGQTTVPEINRVAREDDGADEYDRLINQKYAGESGFMRFAELDHGSWIAIYGIRRRMVRWILGNPTLAITMLRHDLDAGLFVPVELLVTEKADGRGATVLYVRPSSSIAVKANAELKAAVEVLDRKLGALVEAMTVDTVVAPARLRPASL